MSINAKTTAPISSVVADERQSLQCNSNSITNITGNINSFLFRQVDDPNALKTVSLTELYDTFYPPKLKIISNLLYTGVYLYAGAPKVGKSFFMAQLGYHVSCGLSLWDYPVHLSTVLYLALEDDYSRLQQRLFRMFGTESTDNFHFTIRAKNLTEGLDTQLKSFISNHPNTRLIIIDTLQKIREVGGDKYCYASDYEIVSRLKQFAEEYNLCLLLVHHTRKQDSDDSFDTISGTNGLLGAADGAFIMHKVKRTDNKALLDIVGRDQSDQRLHLMFDRERCIWQLTEAETELWKEPIDPVLEAIANFISVDNQEWNGSATELLEQLDTVFLKPNALTRRLNVVADRLWNEYGIRYENSRNHAGRIIRLIKT